MNPILTYGISTNQFPLQASPPTGNPNVVQLTVVASNNTVNAVTLQGVRIQIPVGIGSAELTNASQDIGPVPPPNWILQGTQYPAGFVVYIFIPNAGSGTLAADTSINFIFNNIQVNTSTGSVEIDVTEGSNNCLPPNCPVQKLFITKFPSGWGQVSFWVDSPTIPFGAATVLHWAGPSGATYSFQYYDSKRQTIIVVPAQGNPPLSNKGIYPGQSDPPLILQQSTVFTLNVTLSASGQTYQAQTQITVTVIIPPPVVVSFFAVPASVNIFQPQTVKLQWKTTNAATFDIAGVGSFQGAQAADGSCTVAPTGTTQYFANAYGGSGYAGPPVPANTWVNFMGSASSPYVDVWYEPQSGVVWTLDMFHGRNAISLFLGIQDNPSGKFRVVNVVLPSGVLVANLGTAGPTAGYNAVINGNYGGSVPNNELYIGIGEYDSESVENVGATWGVKFSDGRFALLWFQNAASDGGSIFDDKWTFTFGWILYGPLGSEEETESII